MNKRLENVLKQVYVEMDNRHAKIGSPDFVKTDIDYLINNGYLELNDDVSCMDEGFVYLVEATDEGLHYNEYKKELQKQIIEDKMRFWIPTFISLISLIVAIIALLK